jgi:hypothetical protein
MSGGNGNDAICPQCGHVLRPHRWLEATRSQDWIVGGFVAGFVADVLLACLIPGYAQMPTWLCYLVVAMPFLGGLISALVARVTGETDSATHSNSTV